VALLQRSVRLMGKLHQTFRLVFIFDPIDLSTLHSQSLLGKWQLPTEEQARRRAKGTADLLILTG
jgi:hypothetical protein